MNMQVSAPSCPPLLLSPLFPRAWHLRYVCLSPFRPESEPEGPWLLLAHPEELGEWKRQLGALPGLRKARYRDEPGRLRAELFFEGGEFLALLLIHDLGLMELGTLDREEMSEAARVGEAHLKLPAWRYLFEYHLLQAALSRSPLPASLPETFRQLSPAQQDEICDYFFSKYELQHLSPDCLLQPARYRQHLRQWLDTQPGAGLWSEWRRLAARQWQRLRQPRPTIAIAGPDEALAREVQEAFCALLRQKYGQPLVALSRRSQASGGGLLSALSRLFFWQGERFWLLLQWLRYNCNDRSVVYQGYYFEEIIGSQSNPVLAGSPLLRSLYRRMIRPQVSVALYPEGSDPGPWPELFDTLARSHPGETFLLIAHRSLEDSCRQIEEAWLQS